MSEKTAPGQNARRSQRDRTAATRSRVIDATISSLVELGHAATTISRVQERAGVARGTLLHHFPTRASLLVAVVEDVANRRLHVLADEVEHSGAAGWDAAVDLVWKDLQSPAFLAVLELWVAARTDADLRAALVPVERTVFESVHRAVTTVAADDDPRVPTLVQFTIDLLTGSTMTTLLVDDDGSQRVLLDRWRRAIPVLLGRSGAETWG
ncbi:TetR/AcrR family transcriptional regulator [Aeromicrobium wangtongii]|uniref:TetR/AcrR family transcriptional regulator n=1 Tax=Aeromicrobium wangtongii TaxID=2969247 RepID=A0ABY5M8D2_9ACTN|nr:TetR/AcrR family transcriptional regulator [Aeromicrobium wangtongii]MCD9200119.1 TetR/AcrR family transcriptional regulator [Aeromicrobium wangtongii]UUP13374.1 TetR/AcrR family transcriptional regulator [Aeromicrobium wangtongii]